jgi:glycosyltransferase involved in cell wall biosynthesis
MDGRVELRGPVRHAEVWPLLAESSLVCLPSHGEPYGMVIAEAMSAGRAVVAGEGPGPRLLVDPPVGGLIAEKPAEIAAALITLLNDHERLTAAGAANRERVERELSLSRFLDTLEAAYEGRMYEGAAA